MNSQQQELPVLTFPDGSYFVVQYPNFDAVRAVMEAECDIPRKEESISYQTLLKLTKPFFT